MNSEYITTWIGKEIIIRPFEDERTPVILSRDISHSSPCHSFNSNLLLLFQLLSPSVLSFFLSFFFFFFFFLSPKFASELNNLDGIFLDKSHIYLKGLGTSTSGHPKPAIDWMSFKGFGKSPWHLSSTHILLPLSITYSEGTSRGSLTYFVLSKSKLSTTSPSRSRNCQ